MSKNLLMSGFYKGPSHYSRDEFPLSKLMKVDTVRLNEEEREQYNSANFGLLFVIDSVEDKAAEVVNLNDYRSN